ncbi:class I SAM-dependent methyltransferase [Haloarcula sp. S1CR25-12]|uniref:Class I SAM-dependent methyltransferase n=1 Tax=Haloarcula saliterrae TaxID=2950534 RepID=A0ABU2FEE1_9EURY|nr:class I SAM-dependent methyltransferase [Haloarcula sp. S1CR25-12]MDS0260622.1 class I SAM-dependent methyltransferase [Haloarcula sp. S1CR25-12]
MWADSRDSLADLELEACERVLDVGCGTGELTRVLREESDAEVVALDADAGLLDSVPGPTVRGDATRLPFADDSFDLVVCQALLINLPDPELAVREFARVAGERVAAVEPNNGAVTVESTVDSEPRLARRARRFFLDGVETDVELGADAADVFEAAGLDVVSTRRYDQELTVTPPYGAAEVRAARRKATGEGLATDRATILGGEATPEEYDALREQWREMGRDVVSQMQSDDYERRETVPFFVTVGRVSSRPRK